MGSDTVLLVVEDEVLIRDAWVQELQDAGFKVREADNGCDALEILDAEPKIDALVTDIRMPGAVDGWTLAERARKERGKLPVIYATGYSGEDDRQVPDSVMLKKPMTIRMILDALQSFGLPSTNPQ